MKGKVTLSDNKVIPYPDIYQNWLSEDGASAFAGKTDHPQSRYYKFNDYYNMQSDETLHILTHFRTYQQTTEFTCGAACCLMVLNWFGKEKYHEMLVAELIESIPGTGIIHSRLPASSICGGNVHALKNRAIPAAIRCRLAERANK